jgi:hypothetical protein
LKRLGIYHSRYATRLKPGVNEKAVSPKLTYFFLAHC